MNPSSTTDDVTRPHKPADFLTLAGGRTKVSSSRNSVTRPRKRADFLPKSVLTAALVAGCLLGSAAVAKAQDLTIADFQVGVTVDPAGGHNVALHAKVCNTGVLDSKKFEIGFWWLEQYPPPLHFIPDQAVEVSDGVKAGKCVTRTVWQHVSVKMAFEFAYVRADWDNDVFETHEANNAKALWYTVLSKNPDLSIADTFKATVKGSTVTYHVKVCNTGKNLALPFDLKLYYDRSWAPGCSSKADVTWRLIAGLAPGTCDQKSFVRNNVAHGGYTARALVDGQCEVDETNELNNTVDADYTVGSDKTDLYIKKAYAESADKDKTWSAATVCNKGGTTVTPFHVGFYYDRTSKPSCTDTPDFTLRVPGLAGGSCVERSDWDLPRQGKRAHVYVVADSGCVIPEVDETNNSRDWMQNFGPDLELYSLKASVKGTTATYTVEIRLPGTEVKKPFDLALYYNPSKTPDCTTPPSDKLSFPQGLKFRWITTPIGPDLVRNWIYTFTRSVPLGGLQTVWARVDAHCAVPEYDETNNAKKITHTVGKSDLFLQAFNVAPVGNGGVLADAMVCNRGASVTKTFSLGLYADRTTAPTCSETPDQSLSVSGLPSGQCALRTFIWSSAFSTGTHKAWALADAGCAVPEYNETNNAQSGVYTMGPSSPNLELSSLDTTVSGSTVTYDVKVCNTGKTIPSGSPFVLGLAYDAKAAPACGATFDDEVTVSAGLAEGACITRSFTRKNVAAGSRTAWAVVDAGCTMDELDETDNAASSLYMVGSVVKPELYLNVLRVVVNGADVNYVMKVCNAGAKSGAFRLGLFFDAVASPKCVDTPDREILFSTGLARGACAKRIIKRHAVPSGSYRAWAFADEACVINETKEDNNQKSAAYEVVKVLPDLTISNVALFQTGSTFNLEVTVCNEGTATATASSVGLYADSKSEPTCAGTPDLILKLNSLAPAACQTVKGQLKASGPGIHAAWAMADPACTLTELDETNNAASAGYVIGGAQGDGGLSDGSLDASGLDAMAQDAALGDAGSADAGSADAGSADKGGAQPDQGLASDAAQVGDTSASPATGTDDGCQVGPGGAPSSLLGVLLLMLFGLGLRRRSRP